MRSRTLFLCLVAVVLVTVTGPSTATAQPPDPNSRDALIDAIDGASAEEVAAVQQLAATLAQRQQLDAQVAALDAQVAQVTERLQAAETGLERITAQVDRLQQQIDQTAAQVRLSKTRFQESVDELYKGTDNGGDTMTLVADGADTHVSLAGAKYLSDRSRTLRREITRQGALRDQLSNAQSDLKIQQAAAQRGEQSAASERDQLAQVRARAEARRQQAATAAQQEQQLLDGIRARKSEFEAQYNALQAEIAASVSRGNPTPGNHRFIWPVDGPVVSGFGPRRDPITGGMGMHTGLDIAAGMGTPIKAAGDGVVVSAGENGGYGLFTVVDHGDGLATAYAHQSVIAVSVGQHVGTGEVIGNVGSTGASTGPHLHWEVRVNGTPVDPLSWV